MHRTILLSTALLSPILALAGTGDVIRTIGELRQAIYEPKPRVASFAVEATVIWCPTPLSFQMAVTDGKEIARISAKAHEQNPPLRIGDRIRVSGEILWNDARQINYAQIFTSEIISAGTAPPPDEITAAEVYDSRFTDHVVRMEGVVIDVFHDEIDPRYVFLILSGKPLPVCVSISCAMNDAELERLVDARVSVTGWCRGDERNGPRFNLDRVITAERPDLIRIIQPAPTDPFDVPEIRNGIQNIDPSMTDGPQRRKARGRVLAVWNDNRALIRTPDGVISKLRFARMPPPAVGNFIEAVGLPETDLYSMNLSRAMWRPTDSWPAAEPSPEAVTADFMLTDGNGRRKVKSTLQGRPIRMTGVIRDLPAADSGDCRVQLVCGAHRIPVDFTSVRKALATLEPDSEISVSGICILETENWRPKMPFPQIEGFLIAPRTADDVRVLVRPPWWTPGRLVTVIGSLLVILLATLVWNLLLRRLAERRGRELAEEKRALIESQIKVSERTHLAVELHDSLAQNLTSASLEIETSEHLSSGGHPEMLRHLGIAAKTLRSCREDLRNCMWDLRNRALEEPDMTKAVQVTLIPHINRTRLAVRFNVPRARLSDNTAHVVLRIVRELVLNAVRHGDAKLVMVAGELDGRHLAFSVKDDGCGFDPGDAPGVLEGHFGLQGIRERVGKFGGAVRIESRPGAGCKATVSFDLPDDE